MVGLLMLEGLRGKFEKLPDKDGDRVSGFDNVVVSLNRGTPI